MNKAHWLILGIILVLAVGFVPKAVSEEPADNKEFLEMRSVYYAAHITSKPIQLETECDGEKVWSYGWLNTGAECKTTKECHTMIDDGVSYQIALRSFCCFSGLAKGTCVEVYK